MLNPVASLLLNNPKFMKIDFGYSDFTLLIVSAPLVKETSSEGLLGETCFTTNTILVAGAVPVHVFCETLMHEITHVLTDMFGYGDSGKYTNEELVTALSRGFCLFLNKNFELAEVIANGLRT